MSPGIPLIFENLVSRRERVLPIYDAEFWNDYQEMPAWELSRFLALAENGKPTPAVPLPPDKPRGQQQCEDLEVCVRYLRALLRSV